MKEVTVKEHYLISKLVNSVLRQVDLFTQATRKVLIHWNFSSMQWVEGKVWWIQLYVQHRVVTCSEGWLTPLQDLNVQPDGTVRDNRGVIIQTQYGEDGIDPAKSDYGKVADIDRMIDEMRIKSKAGK